VQLTKCLDPDDAGALAVLGGDMSLVDEVAFTRVVIRRLADLIEEVETVEQASRLGNTLFRGVGRVASLLRTQQALSGKTADAVNQVIDAALDELGPQLGLDL
jgi:hypothetical protein